MQGKQWDGIKKLATFTVYPVLLWSRLNNKLMKLHSFRGICQQRKVSEVLHRKPLKEKGHDMMAN